MKPLSLIFGLTCTQIQQIPDFTLGINEGADNSNMSGNCPINLKVQTPAYTLVAMCVLYVRGKEKKKTEGKMQTYTTFRHIVWVYRALTELTALVVSRLY